jgi:hypothetical protein
LSSIVLLSERKQRRHLGNFPFFIFLLISFYGELFELGTCHVHHKSLQQREKEKERERWPREDGS